jgi:hypothetical protein
LGAGVQAGWEALVRTGSVLLEEHFRSGLPKGSSFRKLKAQPHPVHMPQISNLRLPYQDDLLGYEAEMEFNGPFELPKLIFSVSKLLRKESVSTQRMLTVR